MISDAVLSPDGVYRYWLERIWDSKGETLAWVMLNPSTADHREDDPTIRRCIRFSQKWGFGALVVVNLYAYRATKPTDLTKAEDPVGPLNDEWIGAAVRYAHVEGSFVVAAWGANPAVNGRAEQVMGLFDGVDVRCLGKTKDGHPRHPLYVAGHTDPKEF